MDLIRDPIPVLVRKLAIPASIGFFFNTMYNVVDTFYAGKVSTSALAALSLSFPTFFIVLAIGAGVSQGATALVANSLGAGEKGEAGFVSRQALTLGGLLAVFLSLVGWFAVSSVFEFLRAEGETLELATRYMRVILVGGVFFFVQSILNAGLNAQGDTRTYRNLLIGSFFLNLALDPWFLYGGLGVPAMGIRGVALATVVIQAGGCVYLYFVVRSTPLWKGASARDYIPKKRTILAILGQGTPAALNMMSVALGIFIITRFVSVYGKEGVAAYGVATRVEQIILLPTIGLNIAVLSLAGQNNGAGRMDRVREVWVTTMRYGLLLMVVGGALLFGFRGMMMGFFTEDPVVVQLGADYLGVASITLCSYVFLFQTVFMLQGVKRPMYALWIGLYRQIVAPILVFTLLSRTFGWGIWGIWWGVFIVTWSAAIFTYFYGSRMLARLEADAPAPVEPGV